MSARLQDRSVFVTGAASGIGEHTARRFVAEGARVVLSDINERAGAALAAELGASFVRADVSREEDVAAAVAFAVERHGGLDVMVNNAGVVGAVGPLTDTDAEHWRRTFAILVDSVFFGMKHAGRQMKIQRSGVILSLTSIAGVMGGLGPHAYSAAKHAVVGLTVSAASELSPFGIRVNAVAPGTTVTPLIVQNRGGLQAAIDGAADTSALGTALMPGEIAAALLYLASDDAAHVTAHTLVVDSGRTRAERSASALFHERQAGFVGPAPTVAA